MCLRVDSSGHTNRKKDTFISVYLYINDLHDIVQEHDELCKWPLSGKFSVELLNHYTDSIHQHHMMVVSDPGFEFDDTSLTFSGLGYQKFLSHKLLYESKDVCLVNDMLYFRIIYEDTSNLNQNSYANTSLLL